MDYKLAISHLIEVEKMQNEMSIETLEKIDKDSPLLVLSYLYLIGNEIEKAKEYGQIVADRQRIPNTYRRPEFLEPSILAKKDQVYKAISNFILGKCELHKELFYNSLDKYKQGISYLKNCDVLTQGFKDAILVDFNFIRSKITEQRRAQSALKSPNSGKRSKSPDLKIDVPSYPEIKLTQAGSQRELKVQTNRSNSNLQFHSPQHRFSFGYGTTMNSPQTSQTSLSKIPVSSKAKLTARFNKSIDKIENIEKHDQITLKRTETEDSVKIPLITQPRLNTNEANRVSSIDIKYNNFIDMINPRPQVGTFRRMPSISIASEVLLNSASSRRENIKKPLNLDGKLAGVIDHHPHHHEKIHIPPPQHHHSVKLPSLIDKIEGNDLSEHDVDNLVELVDFMNGDDISSKRTISKHSMRQSENDTLNLSAVKVESIATVVNSLSSFDHPPEVKEEKFKGMNAKEFSLHIFKSISSKDREIDTKGFSAFKKFEEKVQERRTEEDDNAPPVDFKELKKQIREAEKLCASRIQRWWKRVLKNKPSKSKIFALTNGIKKTESSKEGLKNKRVLKNLTITYDTITQTQSDDITSKDSVTTPNPTITSLQVPKIPTFPKKSKSNNQAILVNQDYTESHYEEGLRRSQSTPFKFNVPTAPREKFVIGSLPKIPSSANLVTQNYSKDETLTDPLVTPPKEKKSPEIKPLSEDPKIPLDTSSGSSTIRKRTNKRHGTKKYRPGFKDSFVDGGFNQSRYLRSRSSLHRSKSSEEKSFRYESKKLPEELNETIKLKVMRRYTELKEFQNVNLRFNKAFMKKDQVWFFKYSENSWNLRTQDKKDLMLYFQLYNSSKLSVNIHLPFCDHDKITTEKFITIWPIVVPSIKKWFEEQGFEEEYELYETEKLTAFPKRMYKKIEKAMTQRGLKFQSKFTVEDKRVFQVIQKRLIFLIDKKLVELSKINGKTLFIAKSSLGEKVQMLYDKKTENNPKEKEVIRVLATDPNLSLQNIKYDDVTLDLLKEINDIEKSCFEGKFLSF